VCICIRENNIIYKKGKVFGMQVIYNWKIINMILLRWQCLNLGKDKF